MLPARHLPSAVDAIVNSVRLAAGHRPDVVDGDVLLVTSRSNDDLGPQWEPYVRGRVCVERVDCTHDEMLGSGPLGEIAALVRQRMADREPAEAAMPF